MSIIDSVGLHFIHSLRSLTTRDAGKDAEVSLGWASGTEGAARHYFIIFHGSRFVGLGDVTKENVSADGSV